MKLLIIFAIALAAVKAANLDFLGRPGIPEGRIINGHIAAKGEAPYIVSLKRGSHFCAGSIIDEHWVLTAAHCLIYDSFDVVAGLHQRNDESAVQIRKIPSKAFQIIHEKYAGEVAPYDIGLLYIAEPFDLKTLTNLGDTATVAKINLPSGKYAQTGRGKLYGWGRGNTGGMPNTLQTLDVDIIGHTECKAALPRGSNVDSGNICTYTTGKTDGACNGDSGGPLVHSTNDGVELVGIVSWGYIPCATTRYPSVYTMVSAYKDWIHKAIENYNANKILI